MDNFTNEIIDTAGLPRFEEVQFSVLHPNYWKVTLINTFFFFLILAIGIGLLMFFNRGLVVFLVEISIVFFIMLFTIVLLSRIGFLKKGFAFRTHDVIYRHGIIATNTIVIPYNRVQHVALHEGFISRFFGLAKIEVFTAGGSSSDIQIPGIEIEQAENIKQLLMGKIQKQL
jgi:membrane protein YdbS with pleckstrin-like domain